MIRHAMLRAQALSMCLSGARSAVAPAVARGADMVLSDIARVSEPRRYSREQPLAWQSGADTSSLSPGAQACWWPALILTFAQSAWMSTVVARGADIVLSHVARVYEPRRQSYEQPLAC